MTLAEILAEVREWGTHRDTGVLPDTRMISILNDFLMETLRENDVWFCWSVDTVAMISGTREYALPTRLSRPTAFYTLDGSGVRQDYTPCSYPEFSVWYPTSTSNLSDDFQVALAGTEFLVGPTPSSTPTMYIEGYYYAPTLDAVAVKSNAWTERAPYVCIYGLLDRLTYFGFEENSRGVPFEKLWRQALAAVKKEGHRQLSSARRLTSRRRG